MLYALAAGGGVAPVEEGGSLAAALERAAARRPASSEAGTSPPEAAASMRQEEQPADVSPLVTDRILARVTKFVGVPLAVAFLSPVFFYWTNKIRDPPLEVPTTVVYLASVLTFGPALLGITYGILSASYDPEREEPEGFLGSKEFAKNLPEVISQLRGGRR